jgi:hypothetical protein
MSLIDFAQNSQPLAPGWLRLQAELERAFDSQPDLQAKVRNAIAWLAANADSRRIERRAGA